MEDLDLLTLILKNQHDPKLVKNILDYCDVMVQIRILRCLKKRKRQQKKKHKKSRRCWASPYLSATQKGERILRQLDARIIQ